MIAVEVTGKRGAEGIYFFPKATALIQLNKITGYEVSEESSGFAEAWRSAGSALSVSAAGGMLKIRDMPSVTRLALGLPIDLNRATEEELSLVPGIGETLADQIVQLRQLRGKFEGLADLTAVPGIKEKKTAKPRKISDGRTDSLIALTVLLNLRSGKKSISVAVALTQGTRFPLLYLLK